MLEVRVGAWVLACAISALFHLLVVTPRLAPPAPDADEPPPDFRELVNPRDSVGAVGLAGLAALLVCTNVPAIHLPMWFGFLGAGAALAWVDLRTTWLPRRLNLWCLVQVGLGLAFVATTEPVSALWGAVGGVVAFGFFHLVWLLSSTLGYGDVRLAGIVGTVGGVEGPGMLLTTLFAATLIGALWGLLHALRTRAAVVPVPFPYGPALWLGPVIAAAMS